MRLFGKIIRRAGLPILAVIVVATALVYLFYPGKNTDTLSQSSSSVNVSKTSGLRGSAAAKAAAATGATAAQSSSGSNISDSSSLTVSQTSDSSAAQPAPANPQSSTPPPASSPQPAKYPCNYCEPGGGHMCPMMGGTETYAPQYVCYPCGNYPQSGSLIACRLE